MTLYFDLDRGYFVTAPGTNDRVSSLEMKRGDTVPVNVVFTKGIVVQELGVGATGKLGAKVRGDFDGDFVVAALEWVKSGTETSTVYGFELDLNTEDLDELLGVGAADDEESVTLNFEMEFEVDEIRTSSNTVLLTVQNDVIRGAEGISPGIAGGTPVNGHKASHQAQINLNPGDNSTVTIMGVVYTFKDTPTDPHHVQTEATKEEALSNLVDRINAVDTNVDAELASSVLIYMTAKLTGTAGNSFTLAKSSDSTWTGFTGTFSGGITGTPGAIGKMLVDTDFLYVVSELADDDTGIWKKIALSPLV